MIGAKITRNGDIYVPRFEEGFSSLLDEGVVGEFHTTLDLLNVNSKARLSPKGFFVPGGMEEKHTITFDKAGYFASFSNDLLIRNKIHPTDSIKPNGLNGATKTDYGLIYNTDGSLCATLLPEGGVAVTEGTTNLCDPAYMYTNTWTTIDYSWDRRTYLDCTAGDIISISADIRNLSQGEDRRWGLISFRDSRDIELAKYDAMGSGMSEQRLSFTTPPAPVGTVEACVYWISGRAGFSHQGKNYQIEKKPYATPFVEGTRPAGSLSYDLPVSINGDWTIAKWLELEPYFMDKTLSGDNPIDKYRLPLLELGEKYYTEGYGVIGVYGAWFVSQPGKTICIMANKDTDRVYSSTPDTITLTEAEYNNKLLVVLTKSGPMLSAYIYTVQNKYVLTCNIASLGDISQITPRLNYHTVTASNRMYCKRHLNTLVCPYAVSPETVEAWYNNPVKIGATLKTKGELKEFCPYVLNKGYFAPLNHGLAFIDLATENKFIKPLGME